MFTLDLTAIDETWSLFLDRDGVINYEKEKDYIQHWSEFHFYDGVHEAMKVFSNRFKHIIIVTNQKGVGKGLTLIEELNLIHKNMRASIEESGGRIDAIYYAPELEDDHPNRKPQTGMGLKALAEFPGIDLKKSIMIGNTLSDMEFGRNMGIYTVFITSTGPSVNLNDHRIDAVYASLEAFANALAAG